MRASEYSRELLELEPGQPKLKSNDIVKDAAQRWNVMSPEAKAAIADPLLEGLVASREAADMKPKIAPVHVLNDVSATMLKINREVCHNTAEKRAPNTSPTAGCPARPYGL